MRMSMKSRNELTLQLCRRYRVATKEEKSKILDEFTASSGYNRSYAAMKLRNYGIVKTIDQRKFVTTKKPRNRGGRPTEYPQAVKKAVVTHQELFNYPCSKRLVPLIRSIINEIETIDEKAKQLLMRISPSTIDRMLKSLRQQMSIKRGHSYTRGSMSLQDEIPIRTFGEWKGIPPGSFQFDCVGHDGGIVSGQCCFTLTMTVVNSGWTERYAMLNRAAKCVIEGLDVTRERIPFPIRELHPDNGSEFINKHLFKYSKGKFNLKSQWQKE